MSFAVYLDLRRLSMSLSPSSSDKHAKWSPCSAVLAFSFEMWNNAALCLPLRNPPNSPQIKVTCQVAKCEKHLGFHTYSWSVCQLCFAIFLSNFCWKTDAHESLRYSLEMCSADVEVSQLQRPTHRHHDCVWGDQPDAQSITLFAEGQWMDPSTGITARERYTNQVQL